MDGATAIDTVPLRECLSFGRNSGSKYRGTGVLPSDVVAMYDHTLSPPVPVAVGSPVWARKSFETERHALAEF